MESLVNTCSVEGCSNIVRARGLCRNHYEEWRSDQTPCSVDGCDRGVRAKGLCAMHYYRLRNTGEVGTAEPMRRPERQCKVSECNNVAVTSDDLCATHRRRRRLYGNPDGTFSTHKVCVVCGIPAVAAPRSSDHCAEHYIEMVKAAVAAGDTSIATTSTPGYRYVSIFKKRYAEHTIVMESMIGRPLRDGENVHHKNGLRGDNRPENLELWVSPQLKGQRVEDLVAWVVDRYPRLVADYLDNSP